MKYSDKMNRSDALVLFAIVTAAGQAGCSAPLSVARIRGGHAGASDTATVAPLDSGSARGDSETGNAGWYADDDGDGYEAGDDCDDADADIHPGAVEVCDNGTDEDCDGSVDEGEDCAASSKGCATSGPVDPAAWAALAAAVAVAGRRRSAPPSHPPGRTGHVGRTRATTALLGLALANAGCTGPADDSAPPHDSQEVSDNSGWYVDDDGDGYDTSSDCDDANDAVNPGATEDCGNGIDDDCDLLADGEDDDCTASGRAGLGLDWQRLAFCAPEGAPAGLRDLRGKPGMFRPPGA